MIHKGSNCKIHCERNRKLLGDIIMIKFFSKFKKAEEGVTAIEYGVIGAIIVIVLIAGMQAIGPQLAQTLADIAAAM